MSDHPTRSLPPQGDATADAPAADATRDQQDQTADHAGSTLGTTAVGAPPGYELLEEVGSGGMGVVYRAREVALDRDVAVKLLRDGYPPTSPAARRFLDEARITGQLQHPAIPPVHQVGSMPGGRPFLVMKLIKGDTLADLLAKEPTDRGRFVAAFAQVCQAVAYAHDRKVIHRDLKPGNVMVGAFGEVQVMDWGLAKVLTGQPQHAEPTEAEDDRTEIRTARDAELVTQAGSVLGTPAFMAPEQAQGAVEEIDERADVFGLGAVLCTILTDKPPYSGPSAESVRLKAIRGETADAFARLDACGADPELVSLAKRCLAATREQRPRDAGEVADAVTTHLAAAEERARRAELDRVRAVEERKRRRVQFVLAGSVVLVLALAGFGAGLHSLWRDAEGAREQLAGEKKLTEDARDEAVRQQGNAERARAAEEETRKKLEAVEYGRTVELAYQEARAGSVAAALALLDSTREDRRGWEWHYVHRLCHSDLRTIAAHSSVHSAAFSPDGSRVITAHHEKMAMVWDAKTGAELLNLKGHQDRVLAAVFSPDGSRVVTGSADSTAKVWDAKTGTELLTLKGHTGYVGSISFCSDGSRIVTGCAGALDNSVRVWDAKTGTELLVLYGRGSFLMSAAFSPDGSRIVTCSQELARVWDAKTGTELFALKGHAGGVTAAAFSPDGSRIVTGGWDKTTRVWDAKTGGEVRSIFGHGDRILSVSFSPDGSRVVTGSEDRTAKVWDARTGAELFTLRGHRSSVMSAAFSPDGSRVVTGGDLTARVWDAKWGAEVLTIRHPNLGKSAALSPNGSRVVAGIEDWSGGNDHTAKVWDAKTGAVLLTLKGHRDKVPSGAYSPDGSRVVTGSADKTAKVWDARTGAVLLTLKGHTSTVTSVSFSRDGARILTGSPDGTAKVWDAESGAELLTLKGHTHYVNSAAFSADGSRVVTGGYDKTLRVWDAKTGAELLTLKGHAGGVNSAVFSPDGSRVVAGIEDWSGGNDHTAKVWDARTGAVLLTLKGHTRKVVSVSITRDGSRIVTGGADEAVKVWEANTGAALLTLKGHVYGVSSVMFSADGLQIVTVGSDRTAKVWDARPVNLAFLPKELAPPPHEVTRP